LYLRLHISDTTPAFGGDPSRSTPGRTHTPELPRETGPP
jgi:hypothetical protein